MDVEALIREYLPNIIHMSLGTCADNKPWVCEVHFVYDDGLNLYWRSTPDRRHSEDIAKNPNVAGNIVVQHGPTEKPRGVYFEGTAEMLSGVTENDQVYKLFADRLNKGPEILEDAANPDGNQFYKITVKDWYVFDTRGPATPGKYHWDRETE